jgi:hypothetical protein
MKKLYPLFLFQFIYIPIIAQSPCDSTPANCNWDLRNPIFERVFEIDGDSMTIPIVYGNGTNADYHDIALKLEEDGCIGGDACTGNSENYADTLKIFVYYPKHDYSNATGCKLPPFFFAHAGGYSDCSRLTPEGGSATFCRYMAQRGFVVFSIEYRSGRLLDPLRKQTTPVPIFYNSVFQNSAAYRAAQDIRGAIRYVIYRELNHGSGGINDPYRIDLANIFLGGASAGSVAMLSASYYFQTSGQSMLNDVYPSQSSNIASILGNINIDFYLGNDNLNYMQAVKGICNLWGSVNVPTDYFTGTPHPKDFFANLPYKPPVIGFCGRQDKVFNYNNQPVYYSPYGGTNSVHDFYNRTSYCLNPSYILEDVGNTIDMYNIGAAGFYNMVLQPLGIFSEIYLDCQMAHGLDGNDDACGTCTSDTNPFKKPDLQTGGCKLCGYQSNFGVPTANTSELTYNYIASRVATFFQTIMDGSTGNVTKTSFIECENYRHSCNTDSYSTTNCLTGCSSN